MFVCSCPKEIELQRKLLTEGGLCPICGDLILGEAIFKIPSEGDPPILSEQPLQEAENPQEELVPDSFEMELDTVVQDDASSIVEDEQVQEGLSSKVQSEMDGFEAEIETVAQDDGLSHVLNTVAVDGTMSDSEVELPSGVPETVGPSTDLHAKIIDLALKGGEDSSSDQDFGTDFEEDDDLPTEHTEIGVDGYALSHVSSTVEENTENFPSPHGAIDLQSAIAIDSELAIEEPNSSSVRLIIGLVIVCFAISIGVWVYMSSQKTDSIPVYDEKTGALIHQGLDSHPIEKEKERQSKEMVQPTKPKAIRKDTPPKEVVEKKDASVEEKKKTLKKYYEIIKSDTPIAATLISDEPIKPVKPVKPKGYTAVMKATKRLQQKTFSKCIIVKKVDDPSFSGSWDISFMVTKSGQLNDINVLSKTGTRDDAKIKKCMKRRMSKWSFDNQDKSISIKTTFAF